MTTTILIVAANPIETDRLDLASEQRTIEETHLKSALREFNIKMAPAAQWEDLQHHLAYVMRSPAEKDAIREIVKPGALIRIKAPHEFGKSSLMGRVVAQAEADGTKTVSINFREFDREFLGTLNGFLKHFCVQVTRKLRVPNCLGDYWDGGLGSKGDCGEYFEDYLLPLMSGALVLELDEMDVLFEGSGDKAWAIDFLSMLRAWFEIGAVDRTGVNGVGRWASAVGAAGAVCDRTGDIVRGIG